jgi:hypothetical protein
MIIRAWRQLLSLTIITEQCTMNDMRGGSGNGPIWDTTQVPGGTRHYATRQVAGSRSYEVNEFFNLTNPSGQSQSQSHITTDGQSVSMSWCRAQSGTFDQSFFLNLLSCLFGAPSLTRGWVCHVSVFVIEVYNSLVYLQQCLHSIKHLHVLHTFKINYNNIYTDLVRSRLCTADYALLTSYLVYHGSLRHLDSRTHDRRQVWASYIFCVGPRLVQWNEHFHIHDYGWLLLVACMILLCNHKRTSFRPY